MKYFIFIVSLLVVSLALNAQSFGFESSAASWVPTGTATVGLSTEHYKEGVQSLCWTTTGTSVMTVSFTAFTAGTTNSAYMQIYSPAINNDTLTVEFMNAGLVKRKATFLCNFKGWHEFNRAYTEYVSGSSTSVNSVRITIKPTSSTIRKTYFDDVNFNRTTDAGRIMGSHWLLDKAYLNADTSSLSLFANPIDIPVVTPSAQEQSALTALKITLKRTPAAGTSTALADAKAYATSFNIVRNSDGSVHGNVIDASAAALTDAFMTTLVSRIEILAADALQNPAGMTLFQNFMDHVLDQGISEGCNYMTFSNSYNPVRDIPAGLLDAIPAYTADEKAEVLKLVRWLSFYGSMYYPQNIYLTNQVSDIIYLCLPAMMGVALNQSDDATSVRELKAFKRFLDRNTEYVPGGGDILKPDGTGFHHNTHYNNYMYAYKTWVQYMNYLKGTPFRIAADSYQRFKKAVISDYIMGTLDAGDNHFFANSLCGRKPFDIGVQFSKTYFDYLVAIGTDCLGAQDNELASAYNYFFQTTKYTAPTQKYEGFYQFNYSPSGIYRKANWVATMHAPTANFFGAEIYDNTNRFGRYQSHGSLEIMYSGTLASSGYPSSGATSGGWDWNVIPGTTTVQYDSWQEMMPYKSVSGRFDQRTKTKNYTGALSFIDCGMFSTDFDQIDTWSASAFTATNLVFKKTMFAFDNMIISMGSNISSSGTYSAGMPTTTNLFQNLISSSSGNFIYNGATLSFPYSSTVSTTADNWLITPQGTGYIIPKGNDPIELRYDNQSTPTNTGSDYAAPVNSIPAAKAYLNHGVKPGSKSYTFVVVPATTSTAMQALATQMANGGGSIYQILSQSASCHALLYKPQNITAYSFFAAVSGMTTSLTQIVKSTSSEHLLMDKYDSALNRHSFAICNPNLHPQTDATYGWIATPNQTTLTLAGDWKQIAPVTGVAFANPSGGQTQVTVTMYNGEPVYFGVIPFNDVATNNPAADSDWATLRKKADCLEISFPQQTDSKITIEVTDLSGKTLSKRTTVAQNRTVEYPFRVHDHGFFLCSISDNCRIKTFKFEN